MSDRRAEKNVRFQSLIRMVLCGYQNDREKKYNFEGKNIIKINTAGDYVSY